MGLARSSSLLFLLAAAACGAPGGDDADSSESNLGAIQRLTFTSGGRYLAIEVLDDSRFHVEYASGSPPASDSALYTTPMIARRTFDGPKTFARAGSSFSTSQMKVSVDPGSLCATVFGRTRNVTQTTICPDALEQPRKALTLGKYGTQHVYGLGEEFLDYGVADGSYMGRMRSPGGDFGNAMKWWNGGGPGNTQIPVMYATGDGTSWAFLFDNVYQQVWNFQGDPFRVDTFGDQLRGYVMVGSGLADLRRQYMDLVGRPLVPPKRMFGYWTSEFGYDNWAEVEGKLAGLRAAAFPVDGFALDIFWFGTQFFGQAEAQARGPMGTLRFDASRFPNAPDELRKLRDQQGVGVMLIEESYVNHELPEHGDLGSRGFLAKDCETCGPTFIGYNPWWGKGGMIDWSNDAAGDYWFDQKRKPLVDMGVSGFWTDLGEPEMYNASAWYAGVEPGKHSHSDIHNLYNLKWDESIARGFQRAGITTRPFMMSRAGAAGIQRHGAAMWSGDIGSNAGSLAAHMHAQMHMSMSGIDWYGADIGGFHRESTDGDEGELYTQWLGYGALFDTPMRTHAWNLCNCLETTPDRIGNVAANLASIRLRYALSAYTYSLAHQAHETGDAVYPPMALVFPDDPNVAEMGAEKMIGSFLLAAPVAKHGEADRGVYLPRGRWADFRTGEWISSNGEWTQGVPEYRAGMFGVPLYAREGAIVPEMFVDEKTMNVLGKRSDGSRRDDLVVRVYPSAQQTSFTMSEDDGETTAYLSGQVRKTTIGQQLSGPHVRVSIGSAAGTYAGAPSSRQHVLEVVLPDGRASAVALGGSALAKLGSRAEWDAADRGWFQDADNMVRVKLGSLAVSDAKTVTIDFDPSAAQTSVNFECDGATTMPGESVYVTGSLDALGNWSPASAIKLDPSVYPKWTGVVGGLPPNASFEWKCFVRQENGTTASRWAAGGNASMRTGASGFAGTTYVHF